MVRGSERLTACRDNALTASSSLPAPLSLCRSGLMTASISLINKGVRRASNGSWTAANLTSRTFSWTREASPNPIPQVSNLWGHRVLPLRRTRRGRGERGPGELGVSGSGGGGGGGVAAVPFTQHSRQTRHVRPCETLLRQSSGEKREKGPPLMRTERVTSRKRAAHAHRVWA